MEKSLHDLIAAKLHSPQKKLRTAYNFEVLISKSNNSVNQQICSTKLHGDTDHFSSTAFAEEKDARASQCTVVQTSWRTLSGELREREDWS